MLFQNTIAFATRFIITDLRIFEAIPNMTMFFQDFSCSDSFIITDLRIFEAIPNMTMFFQDFSCSDNIPSDLKKNATESGDMRSLGSLLGWEADDPGDNVILSRLTRLISAHLPDGWQEWRVHTYSKEDLLGNELDPQVLNKVRFAIPTTGLARAFSPNCSSLSERAYRDIKLKLLEWPLCVGLIIGPASLAARIRGSAVQNELVVAALADIKPLLICREEANRELSADTEDNGSVTHSSRRSNSSVRVSKRQDRLSRLEENHMVLKEMLESFMKKFETPFDSQENSACESTDEDSASAYSSENNGPPVTEKSSTQATSAWKPPEPPLGSDDDFDWQPCTKPQDPLIRKKRDKKINVANFNNEEMLKITNQSVPNNKNK
ncbi:hypothetical protein MSG28_009047 [Choristoneura fumiferana]|uniref:Uncharacterized protein n=1 Tax=Choristoneura fumiferana TaxID=7141 RepID=A0ACC0KWK4_CHOFU|nr:hypothetical protein MSG28_009047 [Choristoneura fumiferana]